MLTIKNNIPEIKDKLLRLRTLISVSPNYHDDLRKVLRNATKQVTKLTPKSTSAGSQTAGPKRKSYPDHIANGWTLHTIGGSGKDRVPLLGVVYNRYTHDIRGKKLHKAKLKNATGLSKDYTLLEILEYGSRPHIIRPVAKIGFGRKAKALHFFTRSGAEVFTKIVHHPGTKPYGMVRTTRVKLKFWLRALRTKWERKLVGEWAK